VATHSITGLLGPNGAGKTTCINILCGLLKPDAGKVNILGFDVNIHKNLIREKIGVVPQQIALFDNLSAYENFLYIGRLYGLPDKKILNRSEMLLEKLGLVKHARKRIGSYSGGMKRRANMIASLLHEPELLILDEPTAGVDVQSRALIHSFLKEYHDLKKTILYTSHHLDEAEHLCEHVIIIDEGKNIITGAPKDLVGMTTDACKLEDVFLHFTGHSVRD